MRDYVTILLPVDEGSPFLWARISEEAIIETGESPLSDIQDIAQQNLPIELIIPGQNVQTFEHDLPKMNRREKEKAVLFAIEDSLSTPLESLHIALEDIETEEGDINSVSVIDVSFMQNIQDWATEHNLNLTAIYPDYQAFIGLSEQTVQLSDRVIQAGVLGHTFDPDWYNDEAVSFDTKSMFETIKNSRSQTTNLMQGAFAPRSQFGAIKTPLLQIGGLAAALGLAVLVLGAMKARSTTSQVADIKQQIAELYTSETGQAAPTDPVRAVRLAVRNGNVAPTEFLSLNAIAFQALSEFDDVAIERLSYQNSRNEIQLRLVYPSFERADEVKRAMETAGGLFTPGGVREQNGRFVGEAVLKQKAGAS